MVSPACKKWTTFSVSALMVVLGLILMFSWKPIFRNILDNQLNIADSDTKGYSMWKETPIPIYMEFYMFNWTNAEEYVNNKSITPDFEEFGPYTFYEHHIRENVTINSQNNTVTFYTKRTFKFEPDRTNGSLDDMITTVNPVVLTIASFVKLKHYIVRRGISFLINEKKERLYVTKSVRELLFDGYDDPLIDLSRKLNMSIQIPFTKFGWFVERNNSREYDGLFNINSGGDDINKMGIIRTWNYERKIPYYNGSCADVDGTTGELWYPPLDHTELKIFSPDLCSTIILDRESDFTFLGIKGHKYIANIRNFDNGTKYPDMRCWITADATEPLASGVRNVSLCKFGAPALISFAHFLDADPSYREAVTGMEPDESKHRMFLALEPSTGLPLQLSATLQLSLVMEPIEGIDVLKDVQKIAMPALWFRQSTELSEDLGEQVKILLVLPDAGMYTSYGALGIGALILLIGIYITIRKGWSESEDDTQILTQNSL